MFGQKESDRATVAAGVGCRADCDAEDVVRAILAALELGARDLADVRAIYAPEFKKDEPCLPLVADRLKKPLVFLPLTELENQAAGALTSSEQVKSRFGVPSVAETAALAGAHALSRGKAPVRLVGPRTTFGGATCALAAEERA
ncbi:MAG: cobalamin biosynthesis protein [Polyangiaceae bacterium]